MKDFCLMSVDRRESRVIRLLSPMPVMFHSEQFKLYVLLIVNTSTKRLEYYAYHKSRFYLSAYF